MSGQSLTWIRPTLGVWNEKLGTGNLQKFRDLQAWCARNRVPFYLVVNTPPKHSQGFHDGVMAYIHRLHQDKVRPDLMLVQSWYKYPVTYLPETEKYTMTYTVLHAAEEIKELYGNSEGAVSGVKQRADNYCRSYARQSVESPPSGDGSYSISDTHFPHDAKKELKP